MDSTISSFSSPIRIKERENHSSWKCYSWQLDEFVGRNKALWDNKQLAQCNTALARKPFLHVVHKTQEPLRNHWDKILRVSMWTLLTWTHEIDFRDRIQDSLEGSISRGFCYLEFKKNKDWMLITYEVKWVISYFIVWYTLGQ
jgi:hypothetical protein